MPIPILATAGAAGVATAATAALRLARTAISAVGAQAQRVQSQARDFESVYLAQVLNSMNTTTERTGFDGGHAEEQWRTMLNENMARTVSQSGGVGIADQVQRQLLQVQERRS